jgi:hypothetical protein
MSNRVSVVCEYDTLCVQCERTIGGVHTLLLLVLDHLCDEMRRDRLDDRQLERVNSRNSCSSMRPRIRRSLPTKRYRHVSVWAHRRRLLAHGGSYTLNTHSRPSTRQSGADCCGVPVFCDRSKDRSKANVDSWCTLE